METLIAIFVLGLPTLLVFLASLFTSRERSLVFCWAIVAAVWVAALWFVVEYFRQTDDVGLMVNGIVAGGLGLSALSATIATLITTFRR